MAGNYPLTIRALLLSTAVALLCNFLPVTVALSYAPPPQIFSLGPTGQNLENSTLAMAATLNNISNNNACKVGVSSIFLLYPGSVALPSKTKLPLGWDRSTLTVPSPSSSHSIAPDWLRVRSTC
jgi:hypothetical protein